MATQQAWAKNGWPTCPADGKNPEFYVEVSQGKLTYRDGLSLRQLSSLSGARGRRLGAAWTVSGLTKTQSFQNFDSTLSTFDLRSGRYCAAIKGLNLSFGYKDIIVYLPRKYRRGSCEYESILAHENQHVQIYRDVLFQNAKKIESQLRKYAKKIGPVYARSPQAAQNQIRQMLTAKMKPLFKRMYNDARRRNSRIDTKTNYRREDRKCSNW